MKTYPYTFHGRKILTCLFFLSLVTLYGCPYSSSYKIDDQPSAVSEETYVGKWATLVTNGSGNSEPVKMTLEKINDYEYAIYFTGNINDLRYYHFVKEDTIKGTAFMSTVADRQFMNIQIKGQTFISQFIFKDDKISLLPLCEHFTVKIIRKNSELRQALELHFKTRLYPLYDEPFCLKDMVRVK